MFPAGRAINTGMAEYWTCSCYLACCFDTVIGPGADRISWCPQSNLQTSCRLAAGPYLPSTLNWGDVQREKERDGEYSPHPVSPVHAPERVVMKNTHSASEKWFSAFASATFTRQFQVADKQLVKRVRVLSTWPVAQFVSTATAKHVTESAEHLSGTQIHWQKWKIWKEITKSRTWVQWGKPARTHPTCDAPDPPHTAAASFPS